MIVTTTPSEPQILKFVENSTGVRTLCLGSCRFPRLRKQIQLASWYILLLPPYTYLSARDNGDVNSLQGITMMRVVLLLALSALGIESKTVFYTFDLKAHRPSPALHNQTLRVNLTNPALSPDCNLDRHLLYVNGTNPGPTITADVGDIVKVTVINER